MTESPRLLGSVGGVLRAEGLLLEAVGPEDENAAGLVEGCAGSDGGDASSLTGENGAL